MGQRMHFGDVTGEVGLPPEGVWLIDPEKDKFETPVDERGLIRVPDLIQAVKDTVDPAYEWPSHLSVHHLYWEGEWYSSAFVGERGQKFRNLPVHKALVPRVFENWLHKVTIAPDVPDPEIMDLRTESWCAAEDLFKSVRKAIVWEKRARRRAKLIQQNPHILPEEYNGEDVIGKEILEDILERHFTSIEKALERHENVPPEFRLINPTDTQRDDLALRLGKIVMPRALPLVRAVAA